MIDLLPLDLKKVLMDIEALGFSLTLVGGAPRDYIYSHQLGYDLDFEIRADHLVDRDQWPNYYKKLVAFFSAQKMTFTELPYLITRMDWGEFQLEFSSPRLEFNKVDAINHHHFDARLDTQLSYEESFKRRDLTLNAIGIEWNFLENQERFIDPYGGIDDLKKKELRAISAEYFLDHVRFLRLIRFQIKFSNFLMNSLQTK